MAMVGVDSGSLQVVWLGLRVGWRYSTFYIHQMNRVNSRNSSAMMRTP